MGWCVRVALAAWCAVLPLSRAQAQCDQWTQVPTSASPASYSIDLVYDEARHVALAVGNDYPAAPDYTSILQFNGSSWIPVIYGAGPIPQGFRLSNAICYNRARQSVMLFGGIVGVGAAAHAVDDFWEWNGSSWVQFPKAGVWPPGGTCKMVYDPARDRVILIKSDPNSTGFWTTWEWAGGVWQQGPTLGPIGSGGYQVSFCFDESRGVGFVYCIASDDFYQQVWEYTPGPTAAQGLWQNIPNSGAPTQGLEVVAMAYDAFRHRVVRHAGRPAGALYNFTYATHAWDPNARAWDLITTTNFENRRGSAHACFDPDNDRILLYGGARQDIGPPVTFHEYHDTWALTTDRPGLAIDLPPAVAWCEGQTGVLSVATAGAVSIQWYRNASPIPGATSPILVVSPVTQASAGGYQCVVGNACGVLASRSCAVTVRTPPSVNIQPIADPTACPGTNISIIGPGVAGTAPFTIQLQKQCGEFWCDLPGQVNAPGNIFILQNATNTDTGNYRFAVTNACDTAITATFHIQVGVTFNSFYQDASVAPCDTATFTFSASGVGPLSYQWYHGFEPLSDDGRITGANTPTLTIAGVRYEDEGQYQCAVSDLCQTLSPGVKTLSIPGAPAWTHRTSSGPPRRLAYTTDMAFDEARGVAVLFGGFGGPISTYLADTWEWNGLEWTQKFPAHTPGPRSEHELVYDPARGVILLFGGYSPAVGFNADVWAYDGDDWTLLTTSPNGPTTNYAQQGDAAFDRARNKLIVLAEYIGGPQPTSRTWELDSTTLQWQMTFEGPAPYYRTAPIAFDPSRNTLYGQTTSMTLPWLNTWRYAPGLWAVSVGAQTPDRYWPVLAYDTTRQRVTMFGCCRDIGSPSVYRTDTHAFDGSTWTTILPDFHPNVFDALVPAAMCYDSRRRAMVVVGNTYNNSLPTNPMDTWEYRYFDRPVFDRQPQDQPLAVGATTQFEALATGRGLLTYQWRKDGTPLADGPTPHGSTISGATTPTLTIANTRPQDAGVYELVATGPCGPATSSPASLGGGCRPDLTTTAIPGSPGYGTPNGALNNDDFFYYLTQFAAGNAAVADLTTTAVPGQPGYGIPNGTVNNDDFFFYLSLFAAGC
ncbi:MAG: GC-type dockerin domain-anchored protein [Phycisphaerales bacterium]